MRRLSWAVVMGKDKTSAQLVNNDTSTALTADCVRRSRIPSAAAIVADTALDKTDVAVDAIACPSESMHTYQATSETSATSTQLSPHSASHCARNIS